MEIYRVGGAVRDRLLGLSPKENDYVVVGGQPEEFIKNGFKQVGKGFPVFLHPETHEEYAFARIERKVGSGYTGFSTYTDPTVTLEEDLQRRDLTINAMAETTSGDIIDPYGGQHDLTHKKLRHVSLAFVEDPVRVLRIARFMARFSYLGFQIASETMRLMKTMVQNGEVNALLPERIWREFETALQEKRPVDFIKTLQACGAWTAIYPEWRAISVKDNEKALQLLSKATEMTEDTVIRFVAFIQGMSYLDEPNYFEIIKTTYHRWRLPKIYQELWLLIAKFKSNVQHIYDYDAQAILDLLNKLDVLRRPKRFRQFLILCEINGYQPQKKYLLSAAELIQTVSVKPLLAKKLNGFALKEQLQVGRIHVLDRFIKNFHRHENS